MDLENTYLNEKIRINIIKTYLLHELKKLKVRSDKEQLSKKFPLVGKFLSSNSPSDYFDKLSIEEKWKLFDYVSFGIYIKELRNCVGVPNFKWVKKNISPFSCLFETPIGWMKEKFGKQPINFIEALKVANIDIVKNSIENYDKDSEEKRFHDPLIGRVKGDFYLIHDGNGRLERIIADYILNHKEISDIIAYIGEETNYRSTKDQEELKELKNILEY